MTSVRPAPGYQFEMALAVPQRLHAAHRSPARGLSLAALAAELRADPLQLEPVVDMLAEIDWVSRLDEGDDSRHVLLCDAATTVLTPLVERTLLSAGPASTAFRGRAGLDRLTLPDALAA